MFAFVAFSLKRAWLGFWRNGMMSLAATATMVLMLVLLAGLIIILSGLNSGLAFVEKKVQVVAYLEDSASTAQVGQVETTLKGMSEVTDVAYVSKADALVRFKETQARLGRPDVTDSLPTNPLPASLEIKLVNPQDYAAVVDYLDGLTGDGVVQKVVPVQDLVDKIITVSNVLRTGGVVVLLLVGFTVLFIIVNTIRLAVLARAEEIEIMRLVGASDAFIRWPFIFEGAMVGLLGAAVTIGLLVLVQAPLASFMYSFFQVLPIETGDVLGRTLPLIVLGTGVGIGVVGSYVSVRSYLIR